jgi:hypothetical protein
VESTYKNAKYHGQYVQQQRSLLSACTTANSIIASKCKSTQYHSQYVPERSFMASIYNSTSYNGQHVKEHKVLQPACTRPISVTTSMYKITRHLCGWATVLPSVYVMQMWYNFRSFPNATQLTTVTVQTPPYTVHNLHSVLNYHLLHTDIKRHVEAHSRCSTTLSNACTILYCLYQVTVLINLNSETCKNNLKNNQINSHSSHSDIFIS